MARSMGRWTRPPSSVHYPVGRWTRLRTSVHYPVGVTCLVMSNTPAGVDVLEAIAALVGSSDRFATEGGGRTGPT